MIRPELWLQTLGTGPITAAAYSHANPPPATWRPFSSASPLNTPIPGTRTVHPNSAAVVAWLISQGAPTNVYAGDNDDSFNYPWHWVNDADPIVTMVPNPGSRDTRRLAGLTALGAPHPEQQLGSTLGVQIPTPTVAEPATGTDNHLCFIGADRTAEFWQCDAISQISGGYRGYGAGASFLLSGPGVGEGPGVGYGSATATGFSLLAGQIRVAHLLAAEADPNFRIPHAITGSVRYVSTQIAAPAVGRALVDPAITAVGDAIDVARPPSGGRFTLTYTEAEINALAIPNWHKAILHAIRTYGYFVNDTTAGAIMTLNLEDASPYVLRGEPDPWDTFGAAQGWATDADARIVPLQSGVDWAGRLILLNGLG